MRPQVRRDVDCAGKIHIVVVVVVSRALPRVCVENPPGSELRIRDICEYAREIRKKKKKKKNSARSRKSRSARKPGIEIYRIVILHKTYLQEELYNCFEMRQVAKIHTDGYNTL